MVKNTTSHVSICSLLTGVQLNLSKKWQILWIKLFTSTRLFPWKFTTISSDSCIQALNWVYLNQEVGFLGRSEDKKSKAFFKLQVKQPLGLNCGQNKDHLSPGRRNNCQAGSLKMDFCIEEKVFSSKPRLITEEQEVLSRIKVTK